MKSNPRAPNGQRGVFNKSPSSSDKHVVFEQLEKQIGAEMDSHGRSARFSEVRHIAQMSPKEVEQRRRDRRNDVDVRDEQKHHPKELIDAFRIFADKKTGKITVNNLKSLANEMGERISFEELTEMFDDVDIDGDGMINLDEFVRVMTARISSNSYDKENAMAETGLGRAYLADVVDSPRKPNQIESDAGVLFKAIEIGDELRALRALENGDVREINTKDADGCTMLHLAAARGLAAVVFGLLARPDYQEVNTRSLFSWTALHWSARNGHSEVCRILLESPRFVEVNAYDLEGRTALHYAAYYGHADTCNVILSHLRFIANPIKDCIGNTPLHHAALNDRKETCRTLLSHPRYRLVSAKNSEGNTALHCAAAYGFVDVCRVLLDGPRSVAVDVKNRRDKTAFNLAKGGAKEFLRLVAAGAVKSKPRANSQPTRARDQPPRDRDQSNPRPTKAETSVSESVKARSNPSEQQEESWQSWLSSSVAATPIGGSANVAPTRSTSSKPSQYEVDDGRALLKAIEALNEDAILALLTRRGFQGANWQGDDGCTALHRAAERGLTATCRALLERAAGFHEANRKDSDGCTALHYAALNGHFDTCRLILEHADFVEADAKDCTGCTALHHAALNGHAEALQALLDSQSFADVNARDCTGCTALHHAADNGHVEACRVLLLHPRFIKVSVKDKEGSTALHSAATNGHADVCRALLEDPEVLAWCTARNRKGFTPYDVARGQARETLATVGSSNGRSARRERLVDMASNEDLTRGQPIDPQVLFDAIKSGRESDVLDIISRSDFAASNARDNEGCTVLHRAAERGMVRVIHATMDHPEFCDANAKTSNGCTALHFAALNGYSNACVVLLEHPRFIKMNAKDCTGCSALHHAADNGHVECCQNLLDHPRFAEAEARDRIGWTALHYAALGGHAAACRVIVEHARFTAFDAEDYTPMNRTARAVARGDAFHFLGEVANMRAANANSFFPRLVGGSVALASKWLDHDQMSSPRSQNGMSSGLRERSASPEDRKKNLKGLFNNMLVQGEDGSRNASNATSQSPRTTSSPRVGKNSSPRTKDAKGLAVSGGADSKSVSSGIEGSGQGAQTDGKSDKETGSVSVNAVLLAIEAQDEPMVMTRLARLKAGDIDLTDDDGRTVLHHAASAGLVGVSKSLLKRPGFHGVNAKTKSGATALHFAAANGHAEICQSLLEEPHFTGKNLQDDKGCSAFNLAASGGHLHVFKVLLKHNVGYSINSKDTSGCTALHSAASAGHKGICDLLLGSVAFTEANSVDNVDNTALHLAAQHGHVDVVRTFLQNPDFEALDMKNRDGRTALHFSAAKKPHDEAKAVDCCREILDCKRFTAVNAKDKTGFTVLHFAALKGLTKVCKLIIDCPRFTAADEKDVQGRTASAVAMRGARQSLIDALGR